MKLCHRPAQLNEPLSDPKNKSSLNKLFFNKKEIFNQRYGK